MADRCYAEWCYADCRYAECQYAECRLLLIIMPSVIMTSYCRFFVLQNFNSNWCFHHYNKINVLPRLPISQRHVSLLQKDVSICIEQNLFYLLQLPTFLELRYASLRCDKRHKFAHRLARHHPEQPRQVQPLSNSHIGVGQACTNRARVAIFGFGLLWHLVARVNGA
jgi:hypothetical protein